MLPVFTASKSERKILSQELSVCIFTHIHTHTYIHVGILISLNTHFLKKEHYHHDEGDEEICGIKKKPFLSPGRVSRDGPNFQSIQQVCLFV